MQAGPAADDPSVPEPLPEMASRPVPHAALAGSPASAAAPVANDRHGPPAGFFRAYGITLLLCVLMLLVAGWPHRAIFIVLFAVPGLLYAPYGLVMLAIRPRQRKWRLAKFGLWIAAFALVLVAQDWYASHARSQAQSAADGIAAYRQKKGRYPASFEEGGVKPATGFAAPRLRYRIADGEPRLAYTDTRVLFDQYVYDFKQKRWVLDRY